MKIQGDPVLAEFFRKHGVEPEPSRILRTDWMATAFNKESLGDRRVVDLSCRHKAATRNRNRMTCPRCVELIRHGMDYEGWLRGAVHPNDGLVWREDPYRIFHERSDDEGNFLDDHLDAEELSQTTRGPQC